MPRTKVSVPDVAEVAPGLWSNAIRAGDMLFISGQVARPFEGGTGIVGKDEYEQTKQNIFTHTRLRNQMIGDRTPCTGKEPHRWPIGP